MPISTGGNVSAAHEAVIVDAIRTPIGRKSGKRGPGALADFRADELGVIVLKQLVERNQLDPAQLDDVVVGCVTQTGEQGVNIARNIVLACDGFPVSIPGTSVNRLCASGLQAFVVAAQAIASGMQKIVAVLGTESMNRVPMASDMGAFNPRSGRRFALVSQGEAAELMADKWELTREALDEYAARSQQRALAAVRSGAFDRETIALTNSDGRQICRDETPRETTTAGLAGLKPAFRASGRVTAGNSSQISDGAAGILVTSRQMADQLGLKPRARLRSCAVIGVDPTLMLSGPIPATRMALDRAGLSIDQIDVVELNEAFASVALACGSELKVNWERTNIRGGAIALGHPLGMTGARLLTTALHLLEDRDERLALVTLCIGYGQGQTAIIERVES